MASETGPYNRPNAERMTLETELCNIEERLAEAEEQAAYWSTERARLYEEREELLRRCVAVPRVFLSPYRLVQP